MKEERCKRMDQLHTVNCSKIDAALRLGQESQVHYPTQASLRFQLICDCNHSNAKPYEKTLNPYAIVFHLYLFQ